MDSDDIAHDLVTITPLVSADLKKPLRILHIGNIANNAYLLAKIQNEHGFEAFVISPEYTHVMGFPAWEERELIIEESDHFNAGALGYNPEIYPWFASADWNSIQAKLSIWKTEKGFKSENTDQSRMDPESRITIDETRLSATLANHLLNTLLKKFRIVAKRKLPVSLQLWIANSFIYYVRKSSFEKDQLALAIRGFDILHLYGPYASLIGVGEISIPTVAMEHGTLREWIFAPFPRSRMARKGYERSNAVIITNQDCLLSLPKLNISANNVFKSPHPIQDKDMPALRKRHLEYLKARNNKFRVLIPARHAVPSEIDRGKGTNEILAAIKEVVSNSTEVNFTLIAWGDGVPTSKAYIEKNSLAGRVQWLNLLSRPLLRQQMADHDLIIDQMTIEAYGAITADALGIGCAVATSHSCTNDQAFFGSCAPVESAHKAKDIVAIINELFNSRDSLIAKSEKSVDWYEGNLSSSVVLDRISSCYTDMLLKDKES